MTWSRLRGHAEPVERLRRAAARDRLPHSMLFSGPEGIGKRTAALLLARCLLCRRTPDKELSACGECPDCKQLAAGFHPDLLEVSTEAGREMIRIEQVAGRRYDEKGRPGRQREGLLYELSLTPMTSTRRIAIIDGADRISDDAASALLKTLEEPPESSLIILVASRLDRVLPTIRSRTGVVTFAPLTESDVVSLLLEQELTDDATVAGSAAALSGGSVALAAEMLDPALAALAQTLFVRLSEEPLDPLAAAGDVLAGWEELPGDAARKRDSAAWVCRMAVEFYRGVVHRLTRAGTTAAAGTPEMARFADRLGSGDLDLVLDLADRCFEAERHVREHVGTPLCFETLFDDLARRSRQSAAGSVQ